MPRGAGPGRRGAPGQTPERRHGWSVTQPHRFRRVRRGFTEASLLESSSRSQFLPHSRAAREDDGSALRRGGPEHQRPPEEGVQRQRARRRLSHSKFSNDCERPHLRGRRAGAGRDERRCAAGGPTACKLQDPKLGMRACGCARNERDTNSGSQEGAAATRLISHRSRRTCPRCDRQTCPPR